ncbi:hypothetical protein DUI87_29671 [Hirundo rustica rustica]|uniref:Ig-like domain-containing protein n=1 Tax=Hirundo rustica rustica TaxID=333673 RepID=A0A3M0IZ98_HIRRU|nr:hypothetical protein DUI87_29671 [Hirundo rustica rustica]
MPCPQPAVPSPAVALAGWCPLSPAGAQSTQLLVEPPWTPAVLWDPVTLTCQGSGTAGATTWYKDGQFWWPKGADSLTVTSPGTYTCFRPSTGLSPAVTVSNDRLVLQVPAVTLLQGDTVTLLQGDTVTLRCRGMQNMSIIGLRFYQDEKDLGGSLRGTELLLSPVQLHHSGRYRCRGSVNSWPSASAPVTVTVHGEHPHGCNSNILTPPTSPPSGLRVTVLTSPLLPRAPHGAGVGGSLIPPCRVPAPPPGLSPVRVPAVPVANATVTPGPPALRVRPGEPVTLRCSVQVGSAPVTFTWLRDGQEVARGPLLELGDVDVGQSGTYQCVATNQLGRDGHRVFRALSDELALEVTSRGPWITAARKPQERAPPDPPAPAEEGEVLYTHVVSARPMGGAQSTQLLVEPPWTPAVLWDRVTLTCQGSGTAGATIWYKDGQRLGQEGRDIFNVTESGTYTCDRPGKGRSPPVTVSDDWLVLQVPLWPLLEGDTVTLRCRGSGDKSVTGVTFYYGDEDVRRMSLRGTEQSLSLSPLQLHHRGRYRCRGSLPQHPSPLRPRAPLLHLFYRDGQRVGGPQESPQLRVPAVGVSDSGNYSCQVRSESGTVRKNSSNVHVTVRRVPPSGVSLRAQPPGAQVALGDRLELRCAVAAGTGPLSFSWHRGGSGAPLGTGPRLELRRLGDNDSGRYHCRVSDGDSVAESVPLNVTVLVPVANATVTPGPPALRVRAGEPVTLRCSVQVGSAPVTFTWLRDGQEVARGPLLELGDTERRHSGTYQCVATNQLGRDGHRVFQALSAELALEVTTWGHRDTGSPGATPEVPQVTYAELAAPRWHPGDSGDYENVL